MSASLMVKRSGKRDIRDELRSLAARVLAPLAMCVIGLPVILAVALITVVVPAVLALGVLHRGLDRRLCPDASSRGPAYLRYNN